MQSALASTLAHPGWWAIALAAFLVRGGILVVLLPIVSLPTPASLTTSLAPWVEALVLGRPSLEGVILGTLAVSVILGALAVAGLAGSWLDLALAREAAGDEDLELGWSPWRTSTVMAFAARLIAHLPTMLAVAYASFRLVDAAYAELLSPGDPAVPVALRVIQRTPESVLFVVLAWLLGETVGALAARHLAAGVPLGRAIRLSFRQLDERHGIATFVATTGVLLVIVVPFVVATGRAWSHLRSSLLDGADALPTGGALLLLVATWVLGLAVLGAGLAWRATSWTLLVAPPRPGERDASSAPAAEAATG